jgi:transposase-like protein
LRDILICCCDGLSGLPEAITTAFPQTVVQTCVVHVIRNVMKFVSYGDRKKVAAGMRAIYTAPSLEAAEVEFRNFEADFGEQYPGSVNVWSRAWNEFIPFLDYPPELRRIVYTTNATWVHQLPAPQNHQESGTLPVGRGGDEADLPRPAEHLQ